MHAPREGRTKTYPAGLGWSGRVEGGGREGGPAERAPSLGKRLFFQRLFEGWPAKTPKAGKRIKNNTAAAVVTAQQRWAASDRNRSQFQARRRSCQQQRGTRTREGARSRRKIHLHDHN